MQLSTAKIFSGTRSGLDHSFCSSSSLGPAQEPEDQRADASFPARQTTLPESGTVTRRSICSADLLRGETEVLIDHGGNIYRLRQTRSGKLILHK